MGHDHRETIVRQLLIGLLLGGTAACGNRELGSPRYGTLRLVQDGACTVAAPDGPGFTEVTFLNSTDRRQRATLVRLEDSIADSTILAWYAGSDSIPLAGAEWTGGPGLTLPGNSSTVTLHLSAGRYAALCFPAESDSGERLAPPMARFALDSLSAPPDQEPPLTDAILQIREDSVAWIPNPGPGKRILRITNQGMGTITVVLARIDESGRAEVLGGISELGSGREGWTIVTLRPGRLEVTVFSGARGGPGVVTELRIE